MISEGLEFLKDNFQPLVVDVGGKKFSPHAFIEIEPKPKPLPSAFDVHTLSSLRDLIECNAEKLTESALPLLHIVNHQEVKLLVGVSDEHGRRTIFAKATPVQYESFKFGQYLSPENFIIGVQAHFAQTPDRDYLLDVSSKITDEAVRTAEDDGVSQEVTVKAGLSLKATEKLRARVTLAPFRTFPEADQPKSEFIFRARKGTSNVELVLFEADGGKWKIEAVQNIAFKLRDLGIKLPIIS